MLSPSFCIISYLVSCAECVEKPRGPAAETRPCRILILGDGNFSFSLALARALLLPLPPSTAEQTTSTNRYGKATTVAASHPNPAPGTAGTPVDSPPPVPKQPPSTTKPGKNQQRGRLPYDIVATSFDGRLDLLGKYLESSSILASLRSLGVTVLHNVDATALDSRVVGGASVDDQPTTTTSTTAEQSSCVPSPLLVAAVDEATQRSARETACCSGVVLIAAPQEEEDHSTTVVDSTGQRKGEEEPDVSQGREWRGGAAAASGGAPPPPSSSSSSSSSRQQYDHVIFNHPHTGTEDMRRHRSFLGHFFHALLGSPSTPLDTNTGSAAIGGVAVAVTPPTISRDAAAAEGGGPAQPSNNAATGLVLAPGGTVHVTLAGDQPERWGLREQAARHGFSMVYRRRFPAERIDGFMTKRHQTGRSFQRRNLDSVTLSFARGDDGVQSMNPPSSGAGGLDACVGGGVLVSGGAEGGERCGDGGGSEKRETEMEDGCAGGGGSGGGYGGSLPPWLWPDVDMCGKGASREEDGEEFGRGKEQCAVAEKDSGGAASRAPAAAAAAAVAAAVAGRGNDNSVETAKKDQHNSNGNYVAGRSPSLPEACSLCGKRYKTAQAVRTHTRQVHELGQEGGVPLVEDSKEEPCPHCDRVFTSARALDQHVSAKHSGDFVDIKPDWFVGSIYHVDPPLAAAAAAAAALGDGHDDQESLGRNDVLPGDEAYGMEELNGALHEVNDGRCRPVEAIPASESGNGGSAAQCGVCGFWFLTPEDARQHLDNLRPPIEGGVARFECQSCPKEFGSRRALLQHANFCSKQVQ